MKTGYHAIYESTYYEAVDSAKKYGFEFVQIDLGVPTFFLDNINDVELKNIKNYSRDNGVQLSFHAPGDNVSLFCDYPKIRQGIKDQFSSIIDKANKLDARHITFHAGQSPEFKKHGDTIDEYTTIFSDYYMGILYDNIINLVEYTQDTLICFENSGFNHMTMKVLEKLISEKRIFLTLDTAKSYNKKFEIDQSSFDFMMKHDNKIREIHIHDFSRTYGKHQVVGSGIVEFDHFRKYLFCDDIYMNFEIRPIQSAILSKCKLYEMFNINM